jgi:hypothetical protein
VAENKSTKSLSFIILDLTYQQSSVLTVLWDIMSQLPATASQWITGFVFKNHHNHQLDTDLRIRGLEVLSGKQKIIVSIDIIRSLRLNS